MKCTMKLVIIIVLIMFRAKGRKLSAKQRLSAVETKLSALELRVITDNALSMETLGKFQETILALNTSLTTLENTVLLSEYSEERRPDNVEAQSLPAECCKTCVLQTEGITNAFTKEKAWLRDKLLTLENHFDKQEKNVSNRLSQIRNEIHLNTTKRDKHFGELYETVKNYKNESSRDVEQIESDFKNYQLEMLLNLTENEGDQMEYYKSEMKKRDEVIDKQNVDIQTLKEQVNIVKDILKRLTKSSLNSCPNGWYAFGKFCYFHDKHARLSYREARETCAKHDAYVADIQSQWENYFIAEMLIENRPFWVGVTDENTEGVWTSDRTREPAVYLNWADGNPLDGQRENCVYVFGSDNTWADIFCTAWSYFACKKPALVTP